MTLADSVRRMRQKFLFWRINIRLLDAWFGCKKNVKQLHVDYTLQHYRLAVLRARFRLSFLSARLQHAFHQYRLSNRPKYINLTRGWRRLLKLLSVRTVGYRPTIRHYIGLEIQRMHANYRSTRLRQVQTQSRLFVPVH